MITGNIDILRGYDTIDVTCDRCGAHRNNTVKQIRASRKYRKSTFDYCKSCSCALSACKRPQNSKEFWAKKRASDSYQISYYNGILKRPSIVGDLNPMWGKSHTKESKLKMSKSRTGKTGEQATAWKGGRCSLNKRIKSALQRRYKWFHRVIGRDECKCQECGATKNLDAHHIIPISGIIKRLLIDTTLITETEKMDWLIIQPEIVNYDLSNGITLCRVCHQKIHRNWGSHEPKV